MSFLSSSCITHLPVPLVILDENLNLVAASRQAYSLFRVRFQNENLSELSEKLLSNETFIYTITEASFKLTRAGSSTAVRWENRNQIFDIDIAAMPHGENGLQYGLHFQNMTKRLDIERSRETARNYLEQIIDSLPLGIVVTDCEMRITAINRSQEEIMALHGKDITLFSAIGSLLQELIPQHEGLPWHQVETRLFRERRPLHRLEETLEDNGTKRTFSSSVMPLQKENGDVIGAMHLTEDITEKVRLMSEARDAEMLAARLETLQHTVVTLNHVVNNKLMGLMCNLEVIRSTGAPLSPEKSRKLEEAQDEADAIAQFIRDLSNIKEIKITNYLKDEKMLDISDIKAKGTEK
jgi:PAS domain S-box-containing protein